MAGWEGARVSGAGPHGWVGWVGWELSWSEAALMVRLPARPGAGYPTWFPHLAGHHLPRLLADETHVFPHLSVLAGRLTALQLAHVLSVEDGAHGGGVASCSCQLSGIPEHTPTQHPENPKTL